MGSASGAATHGDAEPRRTRLRTWRHGLTIALCAILGLGALVTAPQVLPSGPVSIGKLATLTMGQAVRYIEQHPHITAHEADANPGAIAVWWDRMTPSERSSLVKTFPAFIGNLDGVGYHSRNQANRIHLRRAIATAKKRQASTAKDPGAALTLQSLLAVRGAIRTRHGSVRRYLVELTEDSPPLASVAIGNPDTAAQITYAVPGMGTYSNDMQLWAQGAQNIYDEQGKVGGAAKRAVIAWIGYVTPPPGIDAAEGSYARRGAPRLTNDMLGLLAARHGGDNITLSVVAHSYGTTTAADALAGDDLGIYAFVMLGSAGIEDTIRNAAALHVQHVYAAEATRDPEARLGRGQRQDPRAPAFGATVLSADGNTAAGLQAVTGHDPVLHSAWNDDPLSSAWSHMASSTFATKYLEHLSSFGYLDAGTESLYDTAIATTKHPTAAIMR